MTGPGPFGWFGPPMPKAPWVLAAERARASADPDGVAVHPEHWSDEYRAMIRRTLSSRLFENIGAAELFTERLDERVAAEESGRKTRLWKSDIASQRLIDGVTNAKSA